MPRIATEQDAPERRGKAPVEDSRVARIIDREEQIETVKDAFGEEVTRRYIKQRILEVESTRAGEHNDVAALEDDSMIDRFLNAQESHNALPPA